MIGSLRIRRVSDIAGNLTDETASTYENYLTRLMRLIPAPAIGLYVFGSDMIPESQAMALLVWSLFCAAVAVILLLPTTQDPSQGKGPDWIHIAISGISFVLWIYALGGPFTQYHLALPWLASLLAAAWSTLVPLIYKGPELQVGSASIE